ncbi:MAG: hypothetical protein PHD15_04070 [Clostridia bacterium]|nr:hypothetical protein [Clostridia bacterium]MDD4386916.1 hypothetical protein [Clostridia bacterium]
MKNIIILYENNKYEINTLQEIVKLVLGEEYLNMNVEEKFKVRYEKAFGICKMNNIIIIDTKVGVLNDNNKTKIKYDILNTFIIDNEETYILSLCKYADMLLLEEKNSEVFNNKELIKNNTNDNYVVINKYVNELLLLNSSC